jgi:hypothetical protein
MLKRLKSVTALDRLDSASEQSRLKNSGILDE